MNCHLFLCGCRQDSSQTTALIELSPTAGPLSLAEGRYCQGILLLENSASGSSWQAPVQAVCQEPLHVTEARPCLQALQKSHAT